MNANQHLCQLGQSIWLDNITREMLQNGLLQKYIHEYAVTGLTSNPTIYENAIRNGNFYDVAIGEKSAEGKSGAEIFFELALEDLTQAADLFDDIHKATMGVDGWVSLEVSPLLANDSDATIRQAIYLHDRAQRDNLFIKIPGTPAGIIAIEEAIFSGVPVNVTLLFSADQYMAAADAYMRGIERRLVAGLDAKVMSVASVFISRWDVAVKDKVPEALNNKLGIAVAQRTYRAYRDLLNSTRWRDLAHAGAPVQRLLWASTGTKDPAASDTLYVEALAAPDTIDTIPEKTLLALADHGVVGQIMSADGGTYEQQIDAFVQAGIDVDALAVRLQLEGEQSFAISWSELLAMIAKKGAALAKGEAAQHCEQA